MSQPSAGPARYFPALTGLRAVAAFAVFFFHQRGIHFFSLPRLDTGVRAVLSELHIGVSVFFTLSGFLITRRYAGQRFDRAAWRDYLLRRAARLLPVYWFLLTLTFVIGWFDPGRVLWRWVGLYLFNLTLLKGLIERWFLTGIGPAWSLTVEEGFYLLAPLAFGLGWRYGPRRAWPLLALGMAGLGLTLYAALPVLGSALFVLKCTLFGRLPEFLIGAAYAWAPPALPRGRSLATAVGAIGVLGVWALLVVVQHFTHTDVSIRLLPGVVLNNYLLPLATGLLLHGLSTEPSRLASALASPLAQLLGRVSYCFYLVHMGLLAERLKPLLGLLLPEAPATFVLFGLLVLASVGLYYLLERPAHRWLLSRFGAPEPTPALGL